MLCFVSHPALAVGLDVVDQQCDDTRTHRPLLGFQRATPPELPS